MPELPCLPEVRNEPLSVVLLAGAAGEPEPSVRAWVSQLEKRNQVFEILVVDDAEEDRTAVLSERLGALAPGIRVLRDTSRRGEGAALRVGLAAAQYPLVCYAVCEPHYRPTDLGLLLEEIDKVHLVTGARAGTPVPVLLRWLGFVYRLFIRVVFGVPLEPLSGWLGWRGQLYRLGIRAVFGVRLSDVNCPFRLLRRSMLSRIPLQSRGRFAHVELLAKANFLGCLLSEVPLRHVPGVGRAPDKSWREDARIVFKTPDFGPATAPASCPEPPVPAAAPLRGEAGPDERGDKESS